uniref:Plac8 onzin related protein 2 n=1 Tax=Oreochromis niloticus TaxID=8128 RepID=A0A669BQB2_ORENI
MGSDVTWLNESNYLVSVAEVQHTMAEKPLTDWDSGLLDCFEDASTCCYGFWCGPCLACTVAGRFGENSCLPLCDICCFITSRYFCVPIFPPPAVLSVRAAMRNRYGIKGSLCKDIAISSCCCTCSWCQMHRELKHRVSGRVWSRFLVHPLGWSWPAHHLLPISGPPSRGFLSQHCLPLLASSSCYHPW